MIGNWLANSGWTNALVQADIITPGKADAVLKASHVTRTRYAHQVSACALHILQKKAFNAHQHDIDDDPVTFTEWSKGRCENHPQFQFWHTALELERMVLEFVKSLRVGNFSLYVQILGQLVPWLFALNHTHYSRWLPVHIRDMLTLEMKHPDVYDKFNAGMFVVQKTEHVFSMIALDQNHEQENKDIKSEGGAVGLTENPAALRRWMISGPEIAEAIKEFESTFLDSGPSDCRHHEQAAHVQTSFSKDVFSLVSTNDEMGNPFMEDSSDLLVLDTKDVMDECVVQFVKQAQKTGQSQYDTYVSERLVKCTTPITDTIKRNKTALFGYESKSHTAAHDKLAVLRNDCTLFSRLYIGCQARDGDVQEFFRHENQASPPSLSAAGKIRIGQKSELLHCIEMDTVVDPPDVTMLVIDGAAQVHMLPPAKSKTFQDYATSVFVPSIMKQANKVQRVDVVWDTYIPRSLQQTTRTKRGTCSRRRVSPATVIPANWKSFLQNDANKNELFAFLAKELTSMSADDLQIISTCKKNGIYSSIPVSTTRLPPCNHEEADTRLLLHAADGSVKGHSSIMIKTVDTDVVLLAVANVHKMTIDKLWISFGAGTHLRYIPAHSIATVLGPDRCEALPFFHAVTGCDTVSSFAGRGKPTAFETWKAYPEITPVFRSLSQTPELVSIVQRQLLERFVVLLYSRTSPVESVNEARQVLFSRGTRSIENIPPTQAALEQHINRAAYQAGHVWGQTLDSMQDLPSPAAWGWKLSNDDWIPLWTTFGEASKSCRELVKCGCRKACRGVCTCRKASLQCSALCFCGGDCHQD
jgi:hypothetical protein